MTKKKIVIVDDDPDILAATAAALRAVGYRVVTATGRVEGMEVIHATLPALIVLDVMMAGWQDGFLMARELKQDPLYADVLILMMTAVKDKTGVDFKKSAGDPKWLPVDLFLEKPVDPSLLVEEVTRLLMT